MLNLNANCHQEFSACLYSCYSSGYEVITMKEDGKKNTHKALSKTSEKEVAKISKRNSMDKDEFLLAAKAVNKHFRKPQKTSHV